MDTTDSSHHASAVAGSLRLNVWYDGDSFGAGGMRHRYRYEITDWDGLADKSFRETDLESGVGDQVDARRALTSLVSFLSAAADAYRSAMSHPAGRPEALEMFPTWVSESAYMNDDELAVLSLDLAEAVPAEDARDRHLGDWPAPNYGQGHPKASPGPSL